MSDILDFMKTQVGRVLSAREVSKEVDEALFERDKVWAARELKNLCSKGLIEAINGCYWIPPEDKNAARLEREREQQEKERLAALLAEEKPPVPEPER